MNEYNTHLYEFAFIASSQLLDVAHELILWNWSLLFAWPQHRQGCSRQRKREGAFTKMKRYWDMSKGHAVVKKSHYRACHLLWWALTLAAVPCLVLAASEQRNHANITNLNFECDMSITISSAWKTTTRPQSMHSLRVCIYTSFHVHLKPHFSFSENFLLFCQNDKLPFSHHRLFYSDFLFR